MNHGKLSPEKREKGEVALRELKADIIQYRAKIQNWISICPPDFQAQLKFSR